MRSQIWTGRGSQGTMKCSTVLLKMLQVLHSLITDTQYCRRLQHKVPRGAPETAFHCCTHTVGRSHDLWDGAPSGVVTEAWG